MVGVAALAGGRRVSSRSTCPRASRRSRLLRLTSDASSVRSHFLSSGSTGRWQLWDSAVEEFRHAPFQGGGAGSFESWWAQHGTLPVFVRNAHSLYLETLAELGIVGFLLVVAFVLGSLALGISVVMRTKPRVRYQPAAPVAVVAAFAFAATLDWVWQLPVIGVVAVACVGLLVGAVVGEDAPAAADERSRRCAGAGGRCGGRARTARRPRDDRRARAAQARPERSVPQRAATATRRGGGPGGPRARAVVGDAAASTRARGGAFGSLPVARAAIDEAVRKDSGDWRLRLIAARLQAKVGDVAAASRSLDAARDLNPRSALFRRVGLSGRADARYVGRVRSGVIALLAAMGAFALSVAVASAAQPLITGIVDPPRSAASAAGTSTRL